MRLTSLPQAAAAQRFGIAPNTWARWERGELPLPPWLQKTLDGTAGQDWYKEKLKGERDKAEAKYRAAHEEATRLRAKLERLKKTRPRRELAQVDELLAEIESLKRENESLKRENAKRNPVNRATPKGGSHRTRPFRRNRRMFAAIEDDAGQHRILDIHASCDLCRMGLDRGVHVSGGRPFCGRCCPYCSATREAPGVSDVR
ncbi:MAG TPA: hypothetical protein VIY49_19170 [Bryobacteraceae bacterium]